MHTNFELWRQIAWHSNSYKRRIELPYENKDFNQTCQTRSHTTTKNMEQPQQTIPDSQELISQASKSLTSLFSIRREDPSAS